MSWNAKEISMLILVIIAIVILLLLLFPLGYAVIEGSPGLSILFLTVIVFLAIGNSFSHGSKR